MVLSSGVVLWRKGFSPWDTSPASSTSSFYCHHIQICHIHLCEATLGFSGRKALVQVCDQGEMLGAPWGAREGALPPTSSLSSSSWPWAKSAEQGFVWWQKGRITQCLWHRGVENRRCSKGAGGGWWDPPRASSAAYSTGMSKREASDILVRDLFGRWYAIHLWSSNANVWEVLLHLFCMQGIVSYLEQSPDFQTYLSTSVLIQGPRGALWWWGDQGCRTQITQWGLILPSASPSPTQGWWAQAGDQDALPCGCCCKGTES